MSKRKYFNNASLHDTNVTVNTDFSENNSKLKYKRFNSKTAKSCLHKNCTVQPEPLQKKKITSFRYSK